MTLERKAVWKIKVPLKVAPLATEICQNRFIRFTTSATPVSAVYSNWTGLNCTISVQIPKTNDADADVLAPLPNLVYYVFETDSSYLDFVDTTTSLGSFTIKTSTLDADGNLNDTNITLTKTPLAILLIPITVKTNLSVVIPNMSVSI